MQNKIDIFSLMLDADFFVKIVVLFLLVTSIISWAIFIKKYREFKEIFKADEEFMDVYNKLNNLNEIFSYSRKPSKSTYATLYQKGYSEYLRIREKSKGNGESNLIKDHFQKFGFNLLQRALEQGKISVSLSMRNKLNLLASFGSLCPFIGLLGTVWGILNSFKSMGTETMSLETVAPGIAEALVATAIGLLAAIPAVFFYNYFTTKIRVHLDNLEIFSEEFVNTIERTLISVR